MTYSATVNSELIHITCMNNSCVGTWSCFYPVSMNYERFVCGTWFLVFVVCLNFAGASCKSRFPKEL